MKINNAVIFVCCLLTFACQTKVTETNASEETEEVSDIVTLSDEQIKQAGIVTGKFEKRNLSSVVLCNGRLELPPQMMASVSSFVGGMVKNIQVIPGEFVKEGELLAVIEHPEIIQLQQEYLKALASFSFMEKDYFRQKELHEENVSAGKKFQQAESDYLSQKALVNALEKRLQLININPLSVAKGNVVNSIPVLAPIHGYINTVSVSTGGYINPSQEMFSIVDVSHIHVVLNVFEKDIDKIKEDQKILFALSEEDESWFEAEVFNVGKSLNLTTKSIEVHGELKNNKNSKLLPGRYVRAKVYTGNEEVNSLSDKAIISDGDAKYIFVKEKSDTGKNNFRMVQVNVGVSDGGYTEVIPMTELNPGADVVLEGAYYLAAEIHKGEGEEE
ncbi:MAG: efflux RND transporter periplasmic adaptor subunit [Cytophagaceae bacterium]